MLLFSFLSMLEMTLDDVRLLLLLLFFVLQTSVLFIFSVVLLLLLCMSLWLVVSLSSSLE